MVKKTRRAIWLFDIKRNAELTNGAVDERMWRDPSLVNSTAQYDGMYLAPEARIVLW